MGRKYYMKTIARKNGEDAAGIPTYEVQHGLGVVAYRIIVGVAIAVIAAMLARGYLVSSRSDQHDTSIIEIRSSLIEMNSVLRSMSDGYVTKELWLLDKQDQDARIEEMTKTNEGIYRELRKLSARTSHNLNILEKLPGARNGDE